MKISESKTAFKIMDVKLGEEKLIFNYLDELKNEKGDKLPKNILTQKVPRIYIIVVDGDIYKIGQSGSGGGMKSTLTIYKDGGVKGSPSVRSYGIFHLMKNKLEQGAAIEFWMIYQSKFQGDVKGLTKIHRNVMISIDPKFKEEYCLLDFKEYTSGKIPIWNFQERGEDWSDVIKKIHADLKVAAANRKGRNKK